jgi:UDP-N-acetylmuramoylalanine--D-glutamate ligase
MQKDYPFAIKSPGIHKSLMTIPYTTATNIFFQNIKGTTIGITGSKGKSTTTALIYSILKAAKLPAHLVGNITHKLQNIGRPMIKELLHNHGPKDIYVCELSSHQLDDILYSPNIAVFTSFFPEHMDFHGNIEKYWEAKKRIATFLKSTDYFVYNPDFTQLNELAKTVKAQLKPIIHTLPFDKSFITLKGEHNITNIKTAITAAKILNISDEIIQIAVSKFQPLPHRLENIGTFKKITFYDDSISTTPESAIAALNAIPNVSTILLGGKDRGFDFSNLAKKIIEKNIPFLILFPESGEKIEAAIRKISKTYLPEVIRTINMKDAVAFAYQKSKPGTNVLLSSASPSYSLWKNFEEKGNLFKKYVVELGNSVL